MWKMLPLDSTSKRQSKKRLFYFILKFLIYDSDYKIKLELDWLIEPIVEPKNVLYIIYIRLFLESN